MGSKDKTVSFRVQEDSFKQLRDISDRVDSSLSQIFRDFVHQFNQHDGRVEAVPKHEAPETVDSEFPEKVRVTTQKVRDHEVLELEVEHLREQLDEYQQHATQLESRLEEIESEQENLIVLEELDTVSEFTITE